MHSEILAPGALTKVLHTCARTHSAVMGVGTCISFFLANPSKVSRIDGSEIVIEKSDWVSLAFVCESACLPFGCQCVCLLRSNTGLCLLELPVNWFFSLPIFVVHVFGLPELVQKSEARKIVGLATDPTMIALLPLFAYSNFFYAYQFGKYTMLFSIRSAFAQLL
jgi:hypothetical protein